jgi:Cu+-exporting ATPase
MVRVPVCGMEIEEKQAHASRQYSGTTFFFCSPRCVGEFDKEPAMYGARPASTRRPQAPSAKTGVPAILLWRR